MEIITSQKVTITDKDKKNIQEGVEWLDNWLQNRSSNDEITQNLDYIVTDENSQPNWQEKYQETSAVLKNVTVVVGKDSDDIIDMIKEGVQSGKFHFTEKYLKRYNNNVEEALEKLKVDTTCGELYGVEFQNIQEPVIFLTEKALNKNITSSVVAHECTHVLHLYVQETAARNAINQGNLPLDQYSRYLDSPEEAYARTMQFRKAFNLDPNKQYTIEDVARIRAEYRKNADSVGNLKSALNSLPQTFSPAELTRAMQSAKTSVPVEQRDLQENFLNRYNDEQIMNLLNGTASTNIPLQNNYDVIKSDMQRDLALSTTKVKLCAKKSNKTSENTMSKAQPSKVEKRNIDVSTIQKLNENQYS